MSSFDVGRWLDTHDTSTPSVPRADERWCPTGSHWLPETSFRQLQGGKLARDCRRCEEKRVNALRAKAAAALPMNGVDIDRIHYKLRKVRPMTDQRNEYDSLRVEFNPNCKHDRTSYSIINCDACVEHTRRMIKLREEASHAEEAMEQRSSPMEQGKASEERRE